MARIPVLIAVTPILSGVVSWALRVRSAFDGHSRYDVRLVSTRGSGDSEMPLDHCVESADDLTSLLQSLGGGIFVPNYMWELFVPACRAVGQGSAWRILGYCRADSDEEYYDPLCARDSVISHYIAVSPTCAAGLEARLPHRGSDMTVLPTGVVLADTLRPSRPSDPLRVTYAGRLVQHQKRVLDIPPIVAQLDAQRVPYQLTIAGDGTELRALQDRLAAQVKESRVILRGRLSADEMHQLWAETDVTLLCSDFEGTSNSLLEAMAAGCVAVASRTESGVEGIVDHGVNGWLFEIGDVQSASQHLAGLAADRDLLDHARQAARDSVVDFSMDRHCETLSSVFDRLMSQPSRETAAARLVRRVDRRQTLQSAVARLRRIAGAAKRLVSGILPSRRPH